MSFLGECGVCLLREVGVLIILSLVMIAEQDLAFGANHSWSGLKVTDCNIDFCKSREFLGFAVVPIPGAQNRQQIQQSGAEEAVYVPDKSATSVSFKANQVHGGQGELLVPLPSTMFRYNCWHFKGQSIWRASGKKLRAKAEGVTGQVRKNHFWS